MAEVCEHYKIPPSHYMRGQNMEGLRFDHMCCLQTSLVQINSYIADYEKRGSLSADAKNHLSQLRDEQKRLRREIETHG